MEIRFCSPAFVQPGAPALAWRGDGGGSFLHLISRPPVNTPSRQIWIPRPSRLSGTSAPLASTLSPVKHCMCPTSPLSPPVSSRFIPSTWRTNVITVLQMFSGVGWWGGVSSDGSRWRTFEFSEIGHGVKTDAMMWFLTCKHADAPPLKSLRADIYSRFCRTAD